MLFNSFSFWIIFPLIFCLYWVIPTRCTAMRKWLLIAVSYLLYMNWKPAFALVLAGVTVVTYAGALAIDADRAGRRRALCAAFTVLALLPLLLFKYYNFVNENGRRLLELAHLSFALPGLNWAVPVGISFFTFQALGYMLDVYHGREKAERDFSDYMLFCSFFPQTASGPISKASELLPQIKNPAPFSYRDGVAGLKWVLWGIVLKCVVADRLGLYVDTVYANYQHFSGLNCLWASVLYTVQIYGDFAGYSLMAIGIARMLGFGLVNNFRRPYLAESVTEFWRRWHISLTRWLTAHVYIPLGGSRCGRGRQYGNIMATFLVSGLWHGANWTFVVWGAIHGTLQIGEKAAGLDPKGRHHGKRWLRALKPLRIVVTFMLVSFAWIFFRMPSLGDAWNVIVRIFTDHTPQPFMFKASNSDKMFTFIALLLLAAVELRAEYLRENTRLLDTPAARWAFYVCVFCMVLAMGVLDSGSFIYVNF